MIAQTLQALGILWTALALLLAAWLWIARPQVVVRMAPTQDPQPQWTPSSQTVHTVHRAPKTPPIDTYRLVV
ncbi:MAG: hypothetical protein AAF968_06345 [Pseudomonadota bacterium]